TGGGGLVTTTSLVTPPGPLVTVSRRTSVVVVVVTGTGSCTTQLASINRIATDVQIVSFMILASAINTFPRSIPALSLTLPCPNTRCASRFVELRLERRHRRNVSIVTPASTELTSMSLHRTK